MDESAGRLRNRLRPRQIGLVTGSTAISCLRTIQFGLRKGLVEVALRSAIFAARGRAGEISDRRSLGEFRHAGFHLPEQSDRGSLDWNGGPPDSVDHLKFLSYFIALPI